MKLVSLSKNKAYIALAVLVVAGFLAYDFFGTATLHLSTDLTQASPRNGILVPEARTDGDKITAEPVYFDLRLPRIYDRAEVSLEYENETNPVVALGTLDAAGNPNLQTYEHKGIDMLEWPSTEIPGGAVFVRPGMEAKNIALSRTAVYDYPFEPALPDTEIRSFVPRQPEIFLKGSHQILAAVNDENLRLTLAVEGQKVPEDILIRLDAPIEVVRVYGAEDFVDGELVIELDELQRGVAKISISTSPETVFSIQSETNRWVARDRLNLAENTGPLTVVTGARRVTVVTEDHRGLQEIAAPGLTLNINDTFRQYKTEFAETKNTLELERGMISLIGRGVFAVSGPLYFNPFPLLVGEESPLPTELFDALYTGYQPQVSVTFNLSSSQDVRFVISIPGIESREPVIMKKVTITLTTDNNIKSYLKTWQKRITKIFLR